MKTPSKSWVQLTLPRHLIPPLMIFAGRLPQEHLWIDPDKPERQGIETDPHITLCYGFKPWADNTYFVLGEFEAAGKVLALHAPPMILLGRTSVFECPNYDVLYVSVFPDQKLLNIHRDLQRVMSPDPAQTERLWVPHVTLAYMEKGTAHAWADNLFMAGCDWCFASADFMLPRQFRDKFGGPITMPFLNRKLIRSDSGGPTLFP